MISTINDTNVRKAAFDWLESQVQLLGDVLPRDLLARGLSAGEVLQMKKNTISGLVVACFLLLMYPFVVGAQSGFEDADNWDYDHRWQVNYSGVACWIALDYIGFGEGGEYSGSHHYTFSIGKSKHWWGYNRFSKYLGIKNTELVIMFQLSLSVMEEISVSNVFISYGLDRVEMTPYPMEDERSRRYLPIYLVGSETAESIKKLLEQEKTVYIQLITGNGNGVKIPLNVHGTHIAVDMFEACLRA